MTDTDRISPLLRLLADALDARTAGASSDGAALVELGRLARVHIPVHGVLPLADDKLFDAIDVEERWDRSRAVTVNPKDVFIATTWWTAHIADAALRDLKRRRFLYLIQEYEPFTFPMGSFHAMAHASYGFDHDALFSTRLLQEYFENHGVGVFEPRSRNRSLT